MIDGKTAIYGLIGSPVSHSLSPKIYNTIFKKRKINAVYLAFESSKQADVVGAIRDLGLSGVNLTIPHKERVLDRLDALHTSARDAQAVNVIINQSGTLTGYNTDGVGFMDSLLWKYPDADLSEVALLGAGGAARAIGATLVKSGVTQLHLFNRSDAPMTRLAAHLETLGSTRLFTHRLSAECFNAIAPRVRLIINCTAGPAAPTIERFSVDAIDKKALWVDINYWMKTPPALDSCRLNSVRVLNGHPMLAWQAAAAAALFIQQVVNPVHVYADLV